MSMNTTFSDGDVLWARKFNLQDIQRYEVVIAKVSSALIIKRVIGLPNETVQIIDGFVYINGEKLLDDYGYETTVYGYASNEVMLSENEYFLMGDNRNNSLDCRIWGAVKGCNIKGVIVMQIFPFWDMKFDRKRK